MKKRTVFALSVTIGVLFFSLGPARAAGWRGDGTGRYPEASLPEDWGRETKVLWKVPLADWGNASPVVSEDRVFITAERMKLLCFSADGKRLWMKDHDPQQALSKEDRTAIARLSEVEEKMERCRRRIKRKRKVEENQAELAKLQKEAAALDPDGRLAKLSEDFSLPRTHRINGYSSATPACNGEVVVAVFGDGQVAAYTVDGEERWKVKVPPPVDKWGHSASPLLVGNTVVVHCGKTMSALALEDGSTVWTAKSETSYGSPILAAAGKTPVIVSTGGEVIDAATGAVLAKNAVVLPWSSALYQDGIVYVMDEKGGTAIRLPEPENGAVTPEVLWTAKIKRDRYYASPLLVNGLLFNLTRRAHMTVLRAENGELVYEKKFDTGARTNVYPSPTLAGDRILVSDDKGTIFVFAPEPAYREISRHAFDPFHSTPAFAGNRMYIRTLKYLYCIKE